MQGKHQPQKRLFQYVDIEELVPEDHILRELNRVINLSSLREKVSGLYDPHLGRPSVDPEVVLRMMLLGYLFNLSERQLCFEVRMHAGYRWFCGLDFNDPVPDRTTLVKLRRERWAQAGVFEALMDEVVRQCVEAGLVKGKHLVVDGTQVTARAATNSLAPIVPAVSLNEYLARFLGSAQERESQAGDDSTPDKADPPEPPMPSRQAGDPDFRGERFSNDTHRSKTDPDARLYRKGRGQEAKLRFLVHNVLDQPSGVILATKSTKATGIAEREAAIELIDHIRSRRLTPEESKTLAGDGSYAAGWFLAELLERGILPLVPMESLALEPVPTFERRTFDLNQARKRKERVSEVQARNRARELAGTILYREAQRSRIRIEHCFAEAKEWHGLDRARGYGLDNMNVQALMTATVQNLKRLAHFLRRGTANIQVAKEIQTAVAGVPEPQRNSTGTLPSLARRLARSILPFRRPAYVPC